MAFNFGGLPFRGRASVISELEADPDQQLRQRYGASENDPNAADLSSSQQVLIKSCDRRDDVAEDTDLLFELQNYLDAPVKTQVWPVSQIISAQSKRKRSLSDEGDAGPKYTLYFVLNIRASNSLPVLFNTTACRLEADQCLNVPQIIRSLVDAHKQHLAAWNIDEDSFRDLLIYPAEEVKEEFERPALLHLSDTDQERKENDDWWEVSPLLLSSYLEELRAGVHHAD